LSWQVYKRVAGRPVDIDLQGLRLRCHPDSHSATRAIYFSGLPDYWEMSFIRDYLRNGDYFADVGANVGLYTILGAALVGPSGHVDAFEPVHGAADRLQQSADLNGLTNVTVHRVAASDQNGTLDFAVTDESCCAHVADGVEGGRVNRVPSVRLDSVLRRRRYAMAKFDLEGYEPVAVRGAGKLMDEGGLPVLLLEMNGLSNRYGVGTSDFMAELERHGYFCAIYDPVTRALTRTRQPWMWSVGNVLAIDRSQAEFVIERLGGNASIRWDGS
jgi:FkbM family methyltransferase